MFFRTKKSSVACVEKYYDEWTDRWTAVGGELIEAYRPTNDQELLNYYINAAELANGQQILDAGCGVCGPAAFFAEQLDVNIDAVTVSQIQIERSRETINQHPLRGTVNITKGDYHNLDKLFASNFYDRVLFLESLGHAEKPEKVLKAAYQVLKSGGRIYIKDFFQKEVGNSFYLKRCREIVRNINRIYAYNTLDFSFTLRMLKKIGFEIIYIRKPQFKNDVAVPVAFDTQNGIDVYGETPPKDPIDWLELYFQKP